MIKEILNYSQIINYKLLIIVFNLYFWENSKTNLLFEKIKIKRSAYMKISPAKEKQTSLPSIIQIALYIIFNFF